MVEFRPDLHHLAPVAGEDLAVREAHPGEAAADGLRTSSAAARRGTPAPCGHASAAAIPGRPFPVPRSTTTRGGTGSGHAQATARAESASTSTASAFSLADVRPACCPFLQHARRSRRGAGAGPPGPPGSRGSRRPPGVGGGRPGARRGRGAGGGRGHQARIVARRPARWGPDENARGRRARRWTGRREGGREAGRCLPDRALASPRARGAWPRPSAPPAGRSPAVPPRARRGTPAGRRPGSRRRGRTGRPSRTGTAGAAPGTAIPAAGARSRTTGPTSAITCSFPLQRAMNPPPGSARRTIADPEAGGVGQEDVVAAERVPHRDRASGARTPGGGSRSGSGRTWAWRPRARAGCACGRRGRPRWEG